MNTPGKELLVGWLQRASCGKHHFKMNQKTNIFECSGCDAALESIDQAIQVMHIERQYPDLVEIELMELG